MKAITKSLVGAAVLLAQTVFAQDPVKISRTEDGRAIVAITIPLSADEGSLNATFDFGATKGFLGPSTNPEDQSGFSNADKTIIGVNHQPVTKSSFVHLFLCCRPVATLLSSTT